MKKTFILIFTFCVFNINAGATDIEKEDKNYQSTIKSEKSLSETNTPIVEENNSALEDYSYGYTIFKWVKHQVSNTKIEQEKFPDINISKLLELCDSQESDYNSIFEKHFGYGTGSNENSSNSYNGVLMIKDIDYGTCRFKFISPQEGFDRNVQHETLRHRQKPYPFFNNWIKNKDDVTLSKGTTYSEGGRIWIDYWGYNKNTTEYVKVKAVRIPSQ